MSVLIKKVKQGNCLMMTHLIEFYKKNKVLFGKYKNNNTYISFGVGVFDPIFLSNIFLRIEIIFNYF
jgi:hypothetical protein